MKKEELAQEELMDSEPKTIKLKCKPTYNFQSVEFEYFVDSEEDVEAMFELYSHILTKLMEIAPEQPNQQPSKPVEEPATEKQIEILKKFKIPFSKNVSKKEAALLIKNSIEKK